MPEMNPDGISIKGCDIIYAPKGQAGEYAPLAANPYRGCTHGCAYCYVPAVIKMERKDFDAAATPRDNFLARLEKDAKKYQAVGSREQVMLSFTTDVYNPFDRSLTRPTIETLIKYGLGFCVLTKGGTRAIEDIDMYRRDRDAFASTLTSLDPAFSKKWERNAASPDDRIAALRTFHELGIFTWVSLEPTLDIEASLAIVRETHSIVDLYKIGRVNYLKMTKTTDWQDYTVRMIELCRELGVAHYIKKDLQPFLPEGYENPLRVKQHHGDEVKKTEDMKGAYFVGVDIAITTGKDNTNKTPIWKEVQNPHDKMFIDISDKEAACVAIVMCGEGWYGIEDTMPLFADDDFAKENFGKPWQELFDSMDKLRVARALESMRLEHERSSMSDPVGWAHKTAEIIRKRIAFTGEGQGEE
jgi:DNA repair photolyase